MLTLYRKHVNGVGTWRIESKGDTIYIYHATVEGGQEVLHTELVETNLSGRTLDEQIKLRINSRVSRMLDKGYKTSREEALVGQSNQLGFLRPMLAQPLGKVSHINFAGAVLQKKLDGHRCLITNHNGEIIAYSRQGKLIPSIKHIIEPLKGRIPEGETIDGELYHHGTPLQTIGSWIKREQPSTRSLMFVAYDMIARESFIDRYNELTQILKGFNAHPIMLLPNIPYESKEHMWDEMAKVRNKGFEGLILRTNDRGYEDGTRSSSLIKIKQFHDTEVKVVGFEQSADGWAVCIYEFEGKIGKCSAPGSIVEKRHVWDHQSEFLGKLLTIEYSMLTVDGVPFHANAIRWRDDI